MQNLTPTIAVKLGAEGGGYDVEKMRQGSQWLYRVHRMDFSGELVGENAVDIDGAWHPTLAQALAELPAWWPQLYPLEVAPELMGDLMHLVQTHAHASEADRERAMELWKSAPWMQP